MSDGNDGMDHAILKLTPPEKAAYLYLFNLADSDSLGVVTGERAVSFFEKTHVPAPVLGEIWQLADTENRGFLSKPGFCMVLRMIGWYQNGQTQPSTELAFKPAPLPRFDGITLPTPPQPVAQSPTAGAFPPGALQPQLSGQSTGGGPIRVPPLDPAKVQQYSGLFERSGAQNGLLDGGTAKSIFERAGLPNEVLGRIWMLSDREQRGALDQTEFIVAMHLLTSMKTRAMAALPGTLPQGLWDAAARRGQRSPSRQMTGAGGIPRQFTGSQAAAQPRTQSPLARSAAYATPPLNVQPTGTPWLITQQEKAQYDQFFARVDTAGKGMISGEQAVNFFSNSNLPEETLAQIWDLADVDSDGQLNREEFAVAMYLIKQQRSPNAQPLPAFLPPALVPPSMRGPQQQQQQLQQPPQQSTPKPSAADDLFGLDSSPTPSTQQQAVQAFQQPNAVLQPQSTGASASRDPFSGSIPASPSSPARLQQPQSTGGLFKQFVPTSAFGASLAQQHTGASSTSTQPQQQQQQRGPAAPMPSAMDDLLGDNEGYSEESSKLTNESTELANMSSQIGNLRTQMEATQNKKSITAADINSTSAQKRDLEQRLQQFRAQYEAEVRTVKDLEQQLAASRESTKKLSQELAMLEGTYQDLSTQHQTISQQLQADQQENSNLKQRIGQLNTEIARLKPEIEKMRLDARQQKGLVSINKKQLSTNEAERDRLQGEKSDLEREAAEHARSLASSPEPPVLSGQVSNVVSPAASTISSTNPFFKKAPTEGSATPSSGPTPSAFDALFGPSSAFAPSGQAGSRTGTPPATSFIGRSLPVTGDAGSTEGARGLGDSMSSIGEPTPAATPPLAHSQADVVSPELPTETPTSAPPESNDTGEVEEAIPGAFPSDDAPATSAEAVPRSVEEPAAGPSHASNLNDDFDKAFAGFGETATPTNDAAPSKSKGFSDEFPPIQNLGEDDDSDSDSDEEDHATTNRGAFDDDFAATEHTNGTAATDSSTNAVALNASATELPPDISKQTSPPAYEQSAEPAHGGSGEQTDSNQFPPEFGGLLPAREDPTSPSPPAGLPSAEAQTASEEQAFLPPQRTSSLQPGSGTADNVQAVTTPSTDIFVDAASRPMSSFTDATPAPVGEKNAFDDFDEFNDLSEAKVAETTDEGLEFGQHNADDFNPAFDSPAASQATTPVPATRSVQQSQSSIGNGFADFTPNVSHNASGSTAGSVQQTPQNVQHDWDAIFSGLDSSKGVDTSMGNGSANNDPWATANGGGEATAVSTAVPATSVAETVYAPPPGPPPGKTAQGIDRGGAITPGTEHDDPILKRLTGMGYNRTDALSALERYDYDINKAVDHLTSQ